MVLLLVPAGRLRPREFHGGIRVPALVLAGEEDILIPVALSRRLHEGVAGSEFATTPGGHACLWEHPAPFNEAFLAFAKRHGKG